MLVFGVCIAIVYFILSHCLCLLELYTSHPERTDRPHCLWIWPSLTWTLSFTPLCSGGKMEHCWMCVCVLVCVLMCVCVCVHSVHCMCNVLHNWHIAHCVLCHSSLCTLQPQECLLKTSVPSRQTTRQSM